jgi:hypothetical protein
MSSVKELLKKCRGEWSGRHDSNPQITKNTGQFTTTWGKNGKIPPCPPPQSSQFFLTVQSITDLERATNRKKSNLSRTLKTMEKYGIVKLVKKAGRIVPQVKATDFKVEFGLHYSSPTRQLS